MMSRHPNFAAEQAIWWFYALFAAAASYDAAPLADTSADTDGHWLPSAFAYVWAHRPLAYFLGAALLSMLFQGSARFTEGVSLRKYPAYAAYQRRVAMFVPWPWALFATGPAVSEADAAAAASKAKKRA